MMAAWKKAASKRGAASLEASSPAASTLGAESSGAVHSAASRRVHPDVRAAQAASGLALCAPVRQAPRDAQAAAPGAARSARPQAFSRSARLRTTHQARPARQAMIAPAEATSSAAPRARRVATIEAATKPVVRTAAAQSRRARCAARPGLARRASARAQRGATRPRVAAVRPARSAAAVAQHPRAWRGRGRPGARGASAVATSVPPNPSRRPRNRTRQGRQESSRTSGPKRGEAVGGSSVFLQAVRPLCGSDPRLSRCPIAGSGYR